MKMNKYSLTGLTVLELSRLLHSRELSAVELTEAYPTEEEARAVFSIQRSLNYEEFYNDIFGDG